MNGLTCTACGAPRDGTETYCHLCGTPQEPLARAHGAPEPRVATTTEPLPQGRPAAPTPAAAWPAPGPSAPRQPPAAGTGRRFAAYVVDALAVGVVVGVVSVLLFSTGAVRVELVDGVPEVGPALAVLGLVQLAAFVAILVWEGRTGRTVGNLLLGTRTVREADLEAPGFGRALVRALVVAVSGVVPLVGPVLVLLSPSFDRSGAGQGWHDRVAGTLVLDVRGEVASAAGASSPERSAVVGTAAPTSPGRQSAASGGTSTWWPSGPPPEETPVLEPADPVRPPASPITGVPGLARPSAEARAAEPVQAVPAPAPAPAPAVAGRAEPEPGDAGEGEVDEATVLRPGQSSAVPTRKDRPRRVEIELENRDRVVVDGPVLVGRNPEPESPGTVVVPVRDRTVSRTHLEIGLSDGPWVMDRGSTSGTVVVRAGSAPIAADAGVRVPVRDGDVVHLGDRSIVVHVGMAR